MTHAELTPILVTAGPMQPRMYSYWPNACVIRHRTYVFAGTLDQESAFYAIYESGLVQSLGPLLPYKGTTEGWYWDAEGYVYVPDGPRLLRANPFSRLSPDVVVDISVPYPGMRLWQAHTSDDGRVHCATLQRMTDWAKVGTLIVTDRTLYDVPAVGTLDESAVTSDGHWVVIKEDDDNRIIRVATGAERRITQIDGAVGHSDCGPSYVIGEDDAHGACVRWDLSGLLAPEDRTPLFDTWNMGHVSVRAGRCLLSNDTILGLVHMARGGVTPILEHGATVTDYDSQVRANLSPCGTVATYMVAGAVYVLRLPPVAEGA